jgi:hypothetical protein
MNFSSLEELRKYTEQRALMTKSFGTSMGRWIAAGFPVVDETKFNERILICHGCEFWDSKGFHGTGACGKCGCSTQAKLRMKSES